MRKLPKKGVLTIAFDDAYLDTYRHAIRHLDRLKIKSTVAVPTAFIGKRFENRRVVGLKELKKTIKSGHEIASHGLTHVNLLKLGLKDKDQTIKEISASKTELRPLLNYKANSFVFPYINKSQTKTLRLKTKCYYKSARIAKSSPCFNKIPLKDPYSIRGFAIMKKHSLSYLNRQVDFAQRNNLWLVEVFHLVARKNTLSAHRPRPYRFFMHIDKFKKHVDYILSNGILILTQKDVINLCSIKT